MNWTLIKAVMKARRNGLLRLTSAETAVGLECLAEKCGKCCKNLGSPVVTQNEATKIAPENIYTNKFGSFIKSHNSTCTLLQNNLCSIYETRPKGCSEFPFYNIGGKLYYDAGCPGIQFDTDARPNVKDLTPFEDFFPNSSKFTIWLIKKICIKK